jgi:hypothetical protein
MMSSLDGSWAAFATEVAKPTEHEIVIIETKTEMVKGRRREGKTSEISGKDEIELGRFFIFRKQKRDGVLSIFSCGKMRVLNWLQPSNYSCKQ